MSLGGLVQIGEVAERTGLSLRTIRYYEEVGIVEPSARSQGGFRLYTNADVDRLRLVKRMKPLEFSLEQMRDLLGILDRLSAAGPTMARSERAVLMETLRGYQEAARARAEILRAQLRSTRDFATELAGHLESLADTPTASAHR